MTSLTDQPGVTFDRQIRKKRSNRWSTPPKNLRSAGSRRRWAALPPPGCCGRSKQALVALCSGGCCACSFSVRVPLPVVGCSLSGGYAAGEGGRGGPVLDKASAAGPFTARAPPHSVFGPAPFRPPRTWRKRKVSLNTALPLLFVATRRARALARS